MKASKIINRQEFISKGEGEIIPLPKYNKYAIGNLRGGIGKTTLTFNLSYLANDVLSVDTCPQGSLSYFYDVNYANGKRLNTQNLIVSQIISGASKVNHVASFTGATNEFFSDRKTYHIPASSEMYLLPSLISGSLNNLPYLDATTKKEVLSTVYLSLKREIEREMNEIGEVSKCLIDTSPFFAGATHLSWYACDALIIPVRTDMQSINSLELLIETLKSDNGAYRINDIDGEKDKPKIQMVVLTHCGWSTIAGAKNEPNQQTKMYVEKVYDILSQNRTVLSTGNPDNHLFLLDDFLGSGRISSRMRKPIELLLPGEKFKIDDLNVEVNKSIEKCKNQLRYINSLLWD